MKHSIQKGQNQTTVADMRKHKKFGKWNHYGRTVQNNEEPEEKANIERESYQALFQREL